MPFGVSWPGVIPSGAYHASAALTSLGDGVKVRRRGEPCHARKFLVSPLQGL